MKTYKAIFLDWDDTIGDFRRSETLALKTIFNKYGLQVLYPSFDDYYAVYHPHNVQLWEQYGRSEISKEQLQFARFFYPIQKLGDKAVDMAHLIGEDFKRYCIEYNAIKPNATEMVRYLAEKYPLTIISNGFVEMQYKKIRLSGLQDCFKYVVLSEEVGAQKPDAKIFEYALRLNALQPSDVLMIGDSYSSDIQGAMNVGIDQMWLTETSDDKKQATYIVNSLREIMSVL